jgi:hypothetical protein
MKRALIVGVCAAAALWAGACSSGGSSITPPPPPTGFSNSDLQGQYAFSMTGTTGDNIPFTRVGSFIADGKGDITGGAEDVNVFEVGSNEYDFAVSTYNVNGDGRGTLTLIDSSGTLTFSITLTSSTSGYLVFMPTDLSSAGNGSFVKQNTASFQVFGISGNYAFDFTGVDPSALLESVVGQLVSNSGGTFSGFADDNDGAIVNGGVAGATTISGSYAADPLHAGDLASFGRGVFTLTIAEAGTPRVITGVFYIVGPNQANFMETSSGGTLTGSSLTQSNIPTTTAQISGGFVYVMGGSGSGVPITRGGRFNTSSGALSTIIVDNNNAGQSISLTAPSGTYTIDPSGNGRGTITFNVAGFKDSFSYVFYLVSPTQAYIQDQSLDIVEDGSMLAQGTGTISNASLAGSYAMNWSGVTSTGAGTGEEDLVGATTMASGALTGTIDLNEFATQSQATDIAMTGTLVLSGNPTGTGHNTLTVNLATPASVPIPAFAYVAANNTILFMGTQTTRIMAGVLTPQAP